ncbi:hypothetical protein F5148DRAFT_1163839 [Russula earlei]|uniref:Uncharacterized protein n=1 Tax=Russula earlei TaxID=71964 RepID=A0ACC0UKN9_9AGAM|nr:hypothetical protein F5148DRAFT_1163839 [Russula earlei]
MDGERSRASLEPGGGGQKAEQGEPRPRERESSYHLLLPSCFPRPFCPFHIMDFFSLPHQKHPTVTEDEDGPTDSFAKAIDDRFNHPPLLPSSSAAHPRITPLTLSLSPISRNSTHLPSSHISPRSHSHHPPTSSPDAALFSAVTPADLPGIIVDPRTLILDLRPLPAYLVSRVPHAVPLSVPSTLLKRPLFSTSKLTEMLPTKTARRKFSQWRQARRIFVYDADSAVLPEGNNLLGLLRKFRSEAGLSAIPQPSDSSTASPKELQLTWLKGGFQAVFRDQSSILDSSLITDDDDDEEAPSPPSFADPNYVGSSEQSDPTSMASRQMTLSMPIANRPTLLRTKHLPMSAFTVSSTTSQRSGSAHHKLYLGHQAVTRDLISSNPPAGPAPSRTEFVSRPSLPGAAAVHQSTSDPAPSVAYNPFFDTIRQNFELPHGITERIPLRISRIAKDRVDDLPFAWLRELSRWAITDGDGEDGEDHLEGESGSGSGSGMSGGDHSGMSSDSGDDSGSGQERALGPYVRMNLPAVASWDSEALAMQFYRIELGEQRRLMGVMEHHSRESGRIMEEGETKSHKSKSKRSKHRSKGTGRSSRGKHASRDFPYSITAGVEKGTKNRYRNIWPFEHARVRLQKQKPNDRPNGKLPTPPFSNPGSLHPITLPRPSDFLPPVTLSLSAARSIQLPLNTPAVSSSTDDYVNASYVQPLGTKKRYIATQGPLPETFKDFWLLVWEQNIHVIVMLTREVEGSTIKCGNYWSGEKFGPLRLKLLEISGAVEEYERSDRRVPEETPFSFTSNARTAPSEPSPGSGDREFPQSTVKRVLELSHTSFSHLPPRRIVQFQYLDWPDPQFKREVECSEESRGSWEGPRRPDDWRGRSMIGSVRPRRSTLRNSHDVSPSGSGSRSSGSGASSPSLDAIDSDTGIVRHALVERPILLHCSAGVGRTGGFIAIDAVLDGVRREMRKRREGLLISVGSWGDGQISRSRSGRNGGERNGHTSGSSTSEKDRTSSGDEVAAMDVDEASGGGRAPPVAGLVMKLPAEDNKAVLHVPVVGMIPSSSTHRPGMEAALSYAASMDVDATNLVAISPWSATVARDNVQAWIPRTHQSERLSSPSSSSAREPRATAPSGESVKATVPQALSRSLSPSGDSSRSDISAFSVPLSVPSTRSLSPSGPDATCKPSQRRTFSSLTTVIRTSSAPAPALANIAGSPASSSPSAAVPSQRHLAATEIAQPVAKRASGHCVPLDTEIGSDSSRGRSTGASSLLSSDTKNGSPDTLPTDPSVMDLSSAARTDLESLRLPLPSMSTRKLGSKDSQSPPANEDSPPNGSDPYYSNSQSQSEQHSPPAFDYAHPRRLHDDRHSPVLLSTLDEPIHRVIEDMREQRMSLCQSLRQYVFVHRAVIEGVLMLVDEERMDNDLEELSNSVAARFPNIPTKAVATSETENTEGSGQTSIRSASGHSGSERTKSSVERRASPTELPKEDKRGDTRTDHCLPEDCATTTRRVKDVALTPLATR